MSIIISQNGKNAKRIDPTNFGKENYLQQYIYENPESIPLYEIKEDIRLLILKREFLTDSGPIDALGIDKEGEIYLIETKLYKNPDKRLVVAQVLDYGASLWSTSLDFNQFISLAEEGIRKNFKSNLHDKLKQFFELDDEGVSQLLENVQRNLDDGKLKFVVLMDKLHDRLKDLILYINENSKFDIYAVELEYYKHDSFEILIPKLFGTEVKKNIGVASGRKSWDEAGFFEDAEKWLKPNEFEAVKNLYNFSKNIADEISFGTGATRASFMVKFHKISQKSLFKVTAKGLVDFCFVWLNDTHKAIFYREKFKNLIKKYLPKVKIPTDYQDRIVRVHISELIPEMDKFKKVITETIKE